MAKELRINEKITSKEVRVINLEGKAIGIFPLPEALKIAEEGGYDLVEVSPNASPPVCRIMDYGRFKYQQSKKLHQAKKKHVQSLTHIKEIKIRPQTEEHDFQFKMRHIKRFLNHGDKTKVSLIFRGREITHPELGKEILERIAEEIEDIGVVEQPPKLEGRNMIMLLAPKS
ncbi:MAG: translation initiation factor IF-3 [Deltaproteobacteria bacterium DG_8]|nr:MAG: translation initiation factor IF-3 [Deltaproteobacteria bacterium DG_8]